MAKPPAAVIVDTSHSPFAHLKPVSLKDITLEPGFWQSRQLINAQVTLPGQLELLESTGRLDNFRRLSGLANKPFQGYVFNDSDVYKWLEAASWTLATRSEGDKLVEQVNRVISLVVQAQDKDGYINTYFSLEKVRERWMNLAEKHELYCAGHLIQAAIAHYRATGEGKLMEAAIRLADHVCSMFGPSEVEGVPGHPEIEMALVELFRTSGDRKYLKQAETFIDRRGNGLLGRSEYLLDHLPLRQMERLAGHAVRALYLCCGATDLAMETGESLLLENLQHLWQVMAGQQMYITGGVGARYEGEAFGEAYELPNKRAYAETCAAIANLMWSWRFLQQAGAAGYADQVEWALYNAVLPGISLDGGAYFYVNPLEDDGLHQRQKWFDCACCPPNVSRTIAAFAGYMYSLSPQGIWFHLYAASKATLELDDGLRVGLEQSTAYPWDAKITIKISALARPDPPAGEAENEADFSLFLRIPAWLEDKKAVTRINGRTLRQPTVPGSYLEVHRHWNVGDRVELEFPMNVRFVASHPLVKENAGRIAITRGPLVYCLEAVDNPGINLQEIRTNPDLPVENEYDPELLDGITKLYLHGYAHQTERSWGSRLYRSVLPARRGSREQRVELVALPYFAWANRQPGEMVVWQRSR